MDKKLLDVFNNLSKALEEVSKALTESKKNKEESGSPVVDSLKSLNITEQLKSIDKGIKETQKDTKEIIKNQKNILSVIQKQQEARSGNDQINQVVDKKQQGNIKDGVKMILMIAGGVLAVGLAFKVIGAVDFKSVITLSLALPLVAIAFEKIAGIKATTKELFDVNVGLVMMAASMVAVSRILQYVSPISADKFVTTSLLSIAFITMGIAISKVSESIKGVDTKNLWKIPLIFVATSAALTFSSWILQYVKPVGLSQLLTTVFIAGAFAVLGYSISKMTQGIKGVDAKDLWKLPLVLVAASVAIAASSYILRAVVPVGLTQLITTILIAGAFTVLSFGLGKLAQSMEKINLRGVAILPLVLIGASAAIMYSSQLLSRVTPITFTQAITTIFISATFVVLSYGLPRLADAVSKVSPTQAAMLPLVLVELAGAITLSSFILSRVTNIPLATLINIAEQSILLTVIGITLGATVYLMGKMGLTVGKVLEGASSLVLLSGAIMASSLLLSMGTYDKYPSLTWTLDTVVSMFAFGVLAAVGGTLLPEIAAGSVGILLIAGTIMASSKILSIGTYDKYPDLSWSLGVSVSMLSFGVGMAAIGTLVIGTGGIGLAALAIGGVGMLLIAGTIVATAAILGRGEYGKFPGIDWSKSVGLSLVGFGAVMGVSGVLLPAVALGSLAIPLIANSIVEVDSILSRGVFKGGPSLSWATSTGLLIGVFGMAMLELGTFIGGTLGVGYLALKAGSKAINLVAQSIVDAALILSTGKFVGGPSVNWAKGVGMSISAFAPVYSNLSKGGIFSLFTGTSSSKDMSSAITTIAQGIITAATFFSNNTASFVGGPSKDWAEGIGGAISAFSPVLSNLSKGGIFGLFTGGLKAEDMKSAIVAIAEGIVSAANFFSTNKASFKGGPTKEWSEGVSGALSAFSPLIDNLDKGGIFGIFKGGLDPDDMKSAIVSMSEAIAQSSIAISRGKYSSIPDDYMKKLSSNVKQYVNLISYLKGSGTKEEKLFGVTVGRSSEISRMADDYSKLANSINKLSGSISSLDIDKITALKTFTGSIVLMSLMDTAQFESMMDTLESKAKVFVDVINNVDNEADGKSVSVRTAASGSSGPGLQEVLSAMGRIEAKLTQISSSNDNISRYVNEIRTPGVKMKKR